jgi:xylose isomerase
MNLSQRLCYGDFGLRDNPFSEVSCPIRFEGIGNRNPLAFACYNPDAIVQEKPMAQHLPIAGARWHFNNPLADMFGPGTAIAPWDDGSDSMENAERKLRAFFYMLYLLDIKYWCWHDCDLVPLGRSLAEFHDNIDVILPTVEELQRLTGIKCGWTTQNLFSHPIFREGAATGGLDSYAVGFAQTKKMLEVGKRLNALNHVFWGGREGYNHLLATLLGEEQKHLALFLRMAVDYAEKIGFKGQFLIEPKPCEPSAYQYDHSASVVIGFLRAHGLLHHFRLNIETNHATLANLSMFHELMVAMENHMLGGVDVNEGTFGNGWDTDRFLGDPMVAFEIMFPVLLSGGLGSGVFNFDAHRYRSSFAPIDLIHAHILGMDSLAWGLRTAAVVIADGELQEKVNARYASWGSGLGAKIEGGNATAEEVATYGHSVLLKLRVEQSSHHEELRSIVLRAMMRAVATQMA